MADVEKLIHACCIGSFRPATPWWSSNTILSVMAEGGLAFIDMGPGGRRRARADHPSRSTPAQVARRKTSSHTGRVLAGFLKERTHGA